MKINNVKVKLWLVLFVGLVRFESSVAMYLENGMDYDHRDYALALQGVVETAVAPGRAQFPQRTLGMGGPQDGQRDGVLLSKEEDGSRGAQVAEVLRRAEAKNVSFRERYYEDLGRYRNQQRVK
jgi:hypothetical protein